MGKLSGNTSSPVARQAQSAPTSAASVSASTPSRTPASTPASNGARSLSSLDLSMEWVRAADLATMGAFNITDAHFRTSARYNKEEVVFTIALTTGPNAGAEAMLSLDETPIRRKLAQQVMASRLPIGPCLLVKERTSENAENASWVFKDANQADIPF